MKFKSGDPEANITKRAEKHIAQGEEQIRAYVLERLAALQPEIDTACINAIVAYLNEKKIEGIKERPGLEWIDVQVPESVQSLVNEFAWKNGETTKALGISKKDVPLVIASRTITHWILHEYQGVGTHFIYDHQGNECSGGSIGIGLNGECVGEVIGALKKRDPNLTIEYTPRQNIEQKTPPLRNVN